MPSAPPGFQASPEVYFRCAEIIDSLGENEGADIEVEDEPFHLVWSALVQLTQKIVPLTPVLQDGGKWHSTI